MTIKELIIGVAAVAALLGLNGYMQNEQDKADAAYRKARKEARAKLKQQEREMSRLLFAQNYGSAK